MTTVGFGLISGANSASATVGLGSGFEDADANLVAGIGNLDWNSFAPVTWNGTAPDQTGTSTALTGWEFTALTDARATGSDSGFAGGVKQDLNCPAVIPTKSPNKADLQSVYIASTTISGHTYLELAWERIKQNSTSADAHIAFEFNQGTTACSGNNDGLVQRTQGDMLVIYDFTSGGTPHISLSTWQTSGPCQVSSDSSTNGCWNPQVDLTNGGFAEGAVNATDTTPILDAVAKGSSLSPSANLSVGQSQFGEAGIDLTGAGIFTQGTCHTFGTAWGVSRSSGSSSTAQMEDLVGPGGFDLSNCGSITIVKHTSPRGVDQNFDFIPGSNLDPSTNPDFLLNDNTCNADPVPNTCANSKLYSGVQPGSYTITEDTEPAGFSFDSVSCKDNTVDATASQVSTSGQGVTITLASGDNFVCTFVNDQQLGAIQITKVSSKTGNPTLAGAGFEVCTNAGPYNTGTDNTDNPCAAPTGVTNTGTTDANGVLCIGGLPWAAGGTDYYVQETTAPTGYALNSRNFDVSVDANATCPSGATAGTGTPKAQQVEDIPLTDLLVTATSEATGGTKSTISCTGATSGDVGTSVTTAVDPASETILGLAPDTYTCTIVVDP